MTMDRRAFVLGILGVAVGTAALSGAAEAAPMPVATPEIDKAQRLEADYKPEVDGAANAEDAQFYFYRPRRRYRRVYYYRPRRRYRRVYRRRIYRRRFRRVYYW
jgi:hypothetical protein